MGSKPVWTESCQAGGRIFANAPFTLNEVSEVAREEAAFSLEIEA